MKKYFYIFILFLVVGLGPLTFDNVLAINTNPELVFPGGPYLSIISYTAVDSNNNIYVTIAPQEVVKLDPSGNQLFKFGSFGTDPGKFLTPSGIVVDTTGNIFVADCNRVQKFNSVGEYQSQIGSYGFENGTITCPFDIAIDSSNNLYVTDNVNNNVQKFNSAGVFQLKFGSSGSGDGQFDSPQGIGLDSRGNIYVADRSNNRFQNFTSSGVFVGWLGGCTSGTNCDVVNQHSNGFSCTAATCSGLTLGIGDGQFAAPWDIVMDSLDNIYTSDIGDRIQKFNSAGVFVGWLGGCDSGSNCDVVNQHSNGFSCSSSTCSFFNAQISKPGQFEGTRGIAVDSLNNIYAGDYLNGRIQKFNSAGVFQTQFGTHGAGGERFVNPRCTAVDSSGNIYVPDTWDERIQKYNSTGVFQSEFGSSVVGDDGGLGFISCVGQDSSDNIYVSDTSRRVHKFTSSGVFVGWLGECTSGINCDVVNQHSNGFSCTAATCSGVTVGSGDGQFFNPYDVSSDSLGNFYISDTNYPRIQKFDSTGLFQGWLGKCTSGTNCDVVNQHSNGFSCTAATCSGLSSGTSSSQFSSPMEIGIDTSNNIYVADSGNARIQKFNSTGVFQSQFGSFGSVNGGEFLSPEGIALDSTNNIYVADYARHIIQIFNSTGVFQSQFGSFGTNNGQFYSPSGITIDSEKVYVAETFNNRVQIFNMTQSQISAPDAITDLTAIPGNAKMTLSWTAPNNGGSSITDYLIQKKLSTDLAYTTFNDGISTATEAVITGLTNGLLYNFRVMAVNSIGTGPASNVVNASIVVCSPPIGPWLITSDCIIFGNTVAPDHVDIQNGALVTIENGGVLDINFATKHLKIHSGSGVLIKSGGKIK